MLTICRNVELYLIDEPMNFLSPEKIYDILKCVFCYCEKDSCIIINSQNNNLASLFDKVIYMNLGRINKKEF